MLFSMNGLNTFLSAVIEKLGWVKEERAQPSLSPTQPQQPEPKQENDDRHLLDYWGNILVALCSAAAIQMALVSAQIQHSQLPAIFCVLGIIIILTFTCFFVSKCIASGNKQAGQITQMLERSGIFFGVSAIFIAITIPFPLWFKVVTCFIYALAWLTILDCNYFNSYILQFLLRIKKPPTSSETPPGLPISRR